MAILRKLKIDFNSGIDTNSEEYGKFSVTIPYVKANITGTQLKNIVNFFMSSGSSNLFQKNIYGANLNKVTLITTETETSTVTKEVLNV